MRRRGVTRWWLVGSALLILLIIGIIIFFYPHEQGDEEGRPSQPPILRVPDGVPTLEEALAQAEPGTVIELTARKGPYGPIMIEVPGIVLRSVGGRAVVDVQSPEGDALRIEAPDVEVRGLEIRSGKRGVFITEADQVRLLDNLVVGSDVGIEAVDSRNIVIQGNVIRQARFVGIALRRGVEGARVEGNKVEESPGVGIRLTNTSRNLVIGNTIRANPQGETGIEISLSNENRIEENHIEAGNVRYIGLILQSARDNRVQGNRISGGQAGIRLDVAPENTLSLNRIEDAQVGVLLQQNSAGVVVEDNEIHGGTAGIYLISSGQVVISKNLITNIEKFGIMIEFSKEDQVIGNTVQGSGVGLLISFSEDNDVQDNRVEEGKWGISVLHSQENRVVRNHVQGNRYAGIGLLQASPENLIQDNVTTGNGFGIRLILSPENQVKGNSLQKNRVGIGLSNSSGTAVLRNAIQANEIGIIVEVLSEISREDTVLSMFATFVSLPQEGDNSGYHVEENNIAENREFGLKNEDSGVSIAAASNWWGHPSGPGGEGGGAGDRVSPYVEFTPWLTAPVELEETE